MPVTEAERHRLYESLKTHLGPAEAETFMNLTPPTDWNDLATKRDIAEIGTATSADVSELRAEFSGLHVEFADLCAEFAGLRAEFAELRAATSMDIAELKADLLRTFGTWLFASQAGVIASVAVLVAFLG